MNRPYVILNAAMSLDGKIATKAGDSALSCEDDLDRLHRLRAEVDAVMVGAGTVLADDPSLTVRRVRGKSPLRVVVDGEGKTPPTAKVLRGGPKTIMAVTEAAGSPRVRKFRKAGAEVLVLGEKEVDLQKLLEELFRRGVRKLLLEGGSTLNWKMLEAGLVDEVRVSVAPVLLGGEGAKSLVGGEGFERVSSGIRLRLKRTRRVGKDLLLVYRVVHKP